MEYFLVEFSVLDNYDAKGNHLQYKAFVFEAYLIVSALLHRVDHTIYSFQVHPLKLIFNMRSAAHSFWDS
ncbi:hypothetical protein ACS0TY_009826 [Phlomoides rotata]